MNKQSLLGTTLAGIALTGTMLSGVAAQASPSNTKTPAPSIDQRSLSAQEQKSAADYWTPERMKSAVSAELILKEKSETATRKGLSTPESSPAPDGPRVDIAGIPAHDEDTPIHKANSESPVRHIGKVFFTIWSDKHKKDINAVCSANSVVSANKNTVSTAGHCVHDKGHAAKNFIFVPAYNNGNAPYGKWAARTLTANTDWTQRADIGEDTAFAVLTPLNGRNLADVVGASGVTFNAPSGQTYKAFGYPAEPPFNGQTLKSCQGKAFPDPKQKSPTQGLKPCDMNGGASGGPWFINGDVKGNQGSNNSYIYKNLDGRQLDGIYAPLWDSSIQALYQSAQR